MCIRDRRHAVGTGYARAVELDRAGGHRLQREQRHRQRRLCLLYTSDAADERSSVDLGGRRIIKKKKKEDAPERNTKLNQTANNNEET